MAAKVKVGGKIIDKAGYFVGDDAELSVAAPPPYVSRGGEKIASVAQKLDLDFKDKIVLDVGSSTGGFTDYALQNGAKKVYAVDVGTGQLDWRLRNDLRVVVMERTDIRSLTLDVRGSKKPQNQDSNVQRLTSIPDIVLIDVSFISLRLVLPAVARLINPNTKVVAMAKPHFEADYATASKHKGVIKNDTIRRAILKNVELFMRQNFVIKAKADSEVLGRKGNKERFYLLKPIRKS